MEIELKLSLDPADAASFRRHPLLKQHACAKPRSQQLTTIYFDTPDLYLRRHRAALRVRRVGPAWLQTLKGGGQVAAGLHQREEWESGVDGPHPDLAALRDLVGRSAWAKVLSASGLAERLIPIFTTRFRRTIWPLRLADGAEVELALDQGLVQHGTARVPISEVELELKSGAPSCLFDFALAIQKTVPLRVGNISKAERGYALYAPQPSPTINAAPLAFPRTLTVEQGFQAIIGNCLEQVQANEAGVGLGVDPENVHQMRIGLRRLRCALRLFDEIAHCPAELLDGIDWLAAKLGAARDWEVFAGSTLPALIHARPQEMDLARLQQAALGLARQNRKKAAAAVTSIRYARLLLALGAWIQGVRLSESSTPSEKRALAAPLAWFADGTLARCHAKLIGRGKRLHTATAESRHKVRIAAKTVRYAIEFFKPLYPAKRARPAIAALTALQEALGQLHDVAIAKLLLAHLAQIHPASAWDSGFAAGLLDARTEQDIGKLGKLWRRFAALKLPAKKRPGAK